jgi:hypothetical protein
LGRIVVRPSQNQDAAGPWQAAGPTEDVSLDRHVVNEGFAFDKITTGFVW